MDDSRPAAAAQGRTLADRLSVIGIGNGQECIHRRAIHIIYKTNLMPENRSGRPVIHNPADSNSRGLQNANKITSISPPANQQQALSYRRNRSTHSHRNSYLSRVLHQLIKLYQFAFIRTIC